MWSRNVARGTSPARYAGPKGPAYSQRAIAVAAIWVFAGAALSACPICFQVEDDGVKAGVRAAVVVLGGITSAVLVGFAVFARRLVRAERKS